MVGPREWVRKEIAARKLLLVYLTKTLAVWNDLLWLSVAVSPFVIWWFIGSPPTQIVVAVLFVLFVLAGYYTWREDYVRLMPKLEFRQPAFCLHTATTEDPEEQRRYVQILPMCSTEAPITACEGHLLRIMHFANNNWVPTELDHRIALNWSFYGAVPQTIFPDIDHRINLFWFNNRGAIALETFPQVFAIRHIFVLNPLRFDVRITASNNPPLDISLRIERTGPQWDAIEITRV